MRCEPGIPATSQLPRLTQVQYDNTIRDLVGIEGNPSQMLAPDTTGSVDQRAWDGYKAAADAVSQQVMANAAAKAKAIPCTPSGDGAACAQQLIDSFGRRAFRRPLTAEESTRFMAIYTNRANVTATGTFDEAAQLIIRSFLLSPSFLTRAEMSGTPDANGRIGLNGYEVATRLSYLLWGSMPDQALLDAAAAGQLSTREQVAAQARRMLQSERVRHVVGDFHRQWLWLRAGEGEKWTTPPDVGTELYADMERENERFVSDVVRNGSFDDLLTASYSYVNEPLAELYGVEGVTGAELRRIELPAGERAGIFTQPLFVASHHRTERIRPVPLGHLVRERVLCEGLPPPPPNIPIMPPGGFFGWDVPTTSPNDCSHGNGSSKIAVG